MYVCHVRAFRALEDISIRCFEIIQYGIPLNNDNSHLTGYNIPLLFELLVSKYQNSQDIFYYQNKASRSIRTCEPHDLRCPERSC